jgi:uncharacterized protein YxeA
MKMTKLITSFFCRYNKRLYPLVLLLSIVATNSSAQEKMNVTGTVIAFNAYPLNKAIIKSAKTGKTVLTDSLGNFSINFIRNDVLLISASGFMEKKTHIKNAAGIVVNLQYGYRETSFNDAVNNGHISGLLLDKALKKYPKRGQKDYSKYNDIFQLISSEILKVKVVGKSVNNIKSVSFSMSPQVLYVVDDMIVSDISYISPAQVQKIEFLEDIEASAYGMRGGNGVLKITLKNK